MNNFERLLAGNWQDVAYSCALIERMLPNYALFSELCEFGDSNVLVSALDLVWSCTAGHMQKVDFEKQLDKLEMATPRYEDFDSFGVRPALDACVALNMLLDVCAGQQSLDVESFEKLYLSTINAYLDFSAQKDDQDEHPLLHDAGQYFVAVRDMLDAESSDSRLDLVKRIKAFSRGINLSNIGLESA